MTADLQHGNRFQHISFLRERSLVQPRPLRSGRVVRWRSLPSAPLAPETCTFFTKLCARWGLEARWYRESIFSRRHAAALRALRVKTPEDQTNIIGRDPAADERALAAVMIGVTAFFRDPLVFESLQPHLPDLVYSEPCFNALSVGCSDGSELYSLGMLLGDKFELKQIRLWGVDCRPSALDRAESGVYPSTSLKAIPQALRVKFLEPFKSNIILAQSEHVPTFRVSDELRSVCSWILADALNLDVAAGLPGVCDLIMCRNLAIYLTAEAAAELWTSLVRRLRTRGILMVGRAERPPAGLRNELIRIGPCLYRKVAAA